MAGLDGIFFIGRGADGGRRVEPRRPDEKRVAGESTKTAMRVVQLLAVNPFLTAKGSAKKLGVAFTTAQRAIERMERLGIVRQTGAAKRNRVYCAKELLDILEEPAHLAPAGNS